jgi:hypothetical protein
MINERKNFPAVAPMPSGCFADRFTSIALRGLAVILVILVSAPFWLLGTALLMLLGAARPFIVFPLGGAALGAVFAGVWFAATGAWGDALQAGMLALVAGGLLAAYGAVFDRFKPDDLPEASPPWWWYV